MRRLLFVLMIMFMRGSVGSEFIQPGFIESYFVEFTFIESRQRCAVEYADAGFRFGERRQADRRQAG